MTLLRALLWSAPMPPAKGGQAGPFRERVAGGLLHFYKRGLSPWLHATGLGHCRYLPTCSEFAYAAVVRHGFLVGGGMAVWRLLRCHPFAKGGFDPVP